MAQRMYFNECGFRRTKSGVCPICGKRATRTKHFYQTINPWNKNKDGSLKTHEQIIQEEKAKANRWTEEPTLHAKCEHEEWLHQQRARDRRP